MRARPVPAWAPLVLALASILAAAAGGCKKKEALDLADDPEEAGKLRKIAARLEEAYGRTMMPPVKEPASLADRLSQWEDFRTCTVKAYAARKRDADMKAREGLQRPTRHASIGDETVEECAVESAVANKDPTMCHRLAAAYRGPNGELPLPAVRCWDTRARVFGLPDECPVVWQPDDAPGRNAECLALARRDASLCPFADSPGRCRALISGDSAACGAIDAAEDCMLALAYWKGLIPAGVGAPLLDLKSLPKEARPGGRDVGKEAGTPDEKPFFITLDLRWKNREHSSLRIEGPRSSTGISWPAGKAKVGWTEDTTAFWGANFPAEAAQVGWREGKPAVKIAFVPGGAASGVRPLQAPGPGATGTIAIVWAEPQDFRRCQPGPGTRGEIRFDTTKVAPGGVVTATIKGEKLVCSDHTELDIEARIRLVILDVR